MGPYAHDMARLHAILGDTEARDRRLVLAAQRLEDAGGTVLAEFLSLQEPAATPPLTPPSPVDEPRLQRIDTGFQIHFLGRTAEVPAVKGVTMIATLLERPGQDVHVLDLVHPEGRGMIDRGDAGEVLDTKARAAYRRRAEALAEALAEARSRSDEQAILGIREELEFLADALAEGEGLAGRARIVGSNVERARVSVRKRIKDGLDRISAVHPEAGAHLALRVRTGTSCCYVTSAAHVVPGTQ